MAAAVAPLMEMEELVEAILLRLPPDDPASLVRASLVCKLWRRILVDAGFRRRFCELHRRTPMLGFLAIRRYVPGMFFTPTSSFRPHTDLRGHYAIDSRHGRVLLARPPLFSRSNISIVVWDPISGGWLELPKLPLPQFHDRVRFRWNAAVLCASNPSSACDGIDCHRGHFLVVLLITSEHAVYVFVYSSQAGMWSETTCAAENPLHPKCFLPLEQGVLAGNALYFKFSARMTCGILKYDLAMQEISWISLPSGCRLCEVHLTTTEYGGLRIARVEGSRLHLLSREAGPGGHLGWAPNIVIELNTVLPANTQFISVLAYLHGLGAFLVSTNRGVFTVDLDSNRARKVCDDSGNLSAVPYLCFSTPVAGGNQV